MRWQTVGQPDPWQLIANPSVVVRSHDHGLVEGADGDVDFLRVPISHECQRCAAIWAKPTQTLCPSQIPRLASGEPEFAALE
jgi:hypothetical protein